MRRHIVLVTTFCAVACATTALVAGAPAAAMANPQTQPWNWQQEDKVIIPNVKSYRANHFHWENMLVDVFADRETGEVPTIKVKSSNKKVAIAKTYKYEDSANAYFHTKGAGKTTITTTITFAGKTKTYKTKLTVTNWSNPVKSLKVGNKEYKKAFKNDYRTYTGSLKKAKVNVTAKSGWKITAIQTYINFKTKAIKNGGAVSFKTPSDYITVSFKNTKTGDKETVKLQAYEIAG